MKHHGFNCHSQAAVAEQIAAVRDDWRRALERASAVVSRARARVRLVATPAPNASTPLELPCR